MKKDLKRLCNDAKHPILLSYTDLYKSGDSYFVCATKSNWRWEKKDYNLYDMPKVNDSRFDDMRADWQRSQSSGIFVSVGTFNSLWARYKAVKDDSGLVFNVSDGNDGPGEYLGPGKPYDEQTYGGHEVRDTCFVVRPKETEPFRFTSRYWYLAGRDLFRMWNYDKDGDDEDIKYENSKIMLSDSAMRLLYTAHVGTLVKASALTHNFTVQADQATTMGRPVSYIPEGVTLRVANGGVLAVNGLLYNDGRIVVDEGGLLVVEENSVIEPYHEAKTNCGGISSAGTIVVEKDAYVVGGGVNGLYLTGGIVYNAGVIASENFTVKKKLVINNQDTGRIVAGKTLPSVWQDELLREVYTRYKGGTVDARDLKKLDSMCTYILTGGTVNIAQGAIYGNTKNVYDFGSFGKLGSGSGAVNISEIVMVSFHTASGWSPVMTALRSELGYRQSDTGRKVTRREVIYASGTVEKLREMFQRTNGPEFDEEAFEAFVESNLAEMGVNLDETVTVRDGVITVNGLPLYQELLNEPDPQKLQKGLSGLGYKIAPP